MSIGTSRQRQAQHRYWRFLFILLSLLGLLCLALMLYVQDTPGSEGAQFVPVDLHSQLEVDYSANPEGPSLPGVRLDLIWDVIYDSDPKATDLAERQVALQNSLLTPVPTVTPALRTCQGVHFVYSSQDTWTDTAEPEAIHGSDPVLQLGRSGDQAKRLLLYFPLNETIPPNTLIHSARLEMDVQQGQDLPSQELFNFASLMSPFSEGETNWASQPEPGSQYPVRELALDSVHIWDVTDIVRAWLLGQAQNTGLMIELQPTTPLTLIYYSREIIGQENSSSGLGAIPIGPRLIITCAGLTPQAVALNPFTPTPTSTPIPLPQAIPSTTTPPSSPTPTRLLPTATLLPPTPTPALPTPTLPLPTLTVPLPTPTVPTPTFTPTPPSEDGGGGGSDDDDGGGGGGDDNGGGGPPARVDLELIKSAPGDITAGTELAYTLTVINRGPDEATNIIVTDTLPAGVSLISAGADQGAGCSGSVSLSCELGTLTPGSRATMTIVVEVGSSTVGELTNSAAASARETELAPDNNTDTTTTTIQTEANLAINKIGPSNPVVAGHLLTYTLVATNAGPSNATRVTITDTLPGGITFASASPGCSNASGIVTCHIGNLAAGGSVQRVVVVTVNAGTVANQTNTVTVAGNETDPIPTSNTDTVTTTIQTESDLILAKLDTPDPVVAGETLTYTLSLTNAGPSNATGVTITDTLPGGVTFASASPGCSNTGGTVTCIIGNLAAGSSVQRTVVVTVNASTTAAQINTATIGGNQADSDSSNNAATITTTVQTETDLAVTKLDTPDPVIAGQVLTYTLSITNAGPSNASGVIITDTLPGGVTFTSAPPGCGNVGGTVSCNIGNLNAGSNVQRTIVVTVNASTTVAQINTATTDGNETDPVPANNADTVTTTIQSEINLVITKVGTPNPVVAGEILTYTLSLTNTGPSDATGVIITDTLPGGVTFASASPGCSNTGGTVTCNIGNLAVGGNVQRTIVVTVNTGTITDQTNTATAGSNETDPAPANNTDTVTTTIQAETDLIVTKADTPNPVVAGETLTYTLSLTNIGLSDATGVVITDTLPGGVTFASASAGCSNAGGLVTCSIGNVPVGSNVQRIIVVTVNASTTAAQINTVTTSGNGTDPVPTNNTDTVTTTIQREADLVVTKLDTPDPVVAGETLTYTLSITNAGPSNASGVIITDTLPGDVTFASASPGCSNVGGTVSCNVGNLVVGGTVQRTIVVTVNTSTAAAQINTAIIGGNEADPVPANNTATVTTTIQAESDLIITKVGIPNPVVAGETLTYTLNLTNAGPSDATGVMITDTLPGGVTFASASSGCSNAGGTVTCTIGNLAAGSAVQRTIVVTINASTTAAQINSAITGGNETDPVLGNNTDTVTTTIQAETDLVITKVGTPNPVIAGQTLTYTLSLTNTGPSNATGVMITDTLPSGVTFISASPGCSNVGGTVTCNIGSLPAGSNAQRTVVVTVNAGTVTNQTNTVTAGGNETDPVPTNNTDTVTTTVQTETDLIVTKADTPDPVVAGEMLTYTLSLTNAGPSDATGVIITDTLPGGVTFASASPGCSNAGGTVTCTIGNLAAGSNVQRILMVTVNPGTVTSQTNTVIAGGNEADPLSANNTDTLTTTVQTETDLVTGKSGTPDPVIAGQMLTYTLSLTNVGPSDATGVIITDTLSGGVTFASASPDCSYAGGTVSCNIGNLNVGSTIQRTIVVTVNAGTVTSQLNTVTAGGNETDPALGNNTAMLTTTVQTETDLILTKADTPDPVVAGESLTYTLTLTNAGPSNAAGVVMTDTLPGSVLFISASAGCAETGGLVTCTIGSLAAGAVSVVTVTVSVSPNTTGVLTNTAGSSATTTDPVSLNNTVSVTTTVSQLANLGLSKQGSATTVVSGGTFTYTLVAVNNGPSDATSVSLTDTLPVSLTLVSSTTTQGSCNSSSTITCNLGSLAANGVATVTFRVNVHPAAKAVQVNTATITSATPDSDPSDNTTSESTQVGVLDINKSSSPAGPVSPGQLLTYTITVANIGSAVETNVTLIDPLPAGVSYVPGSAIITRPVIHTLRDEFNAVNYNGNDGSQNWTAAWQELGEANGPGADSVLVVSDARCAVGNCIRIGGLNILFTGLGLAREANLSGISSAFLTFSYRRQLLLLAGGKVTLAASNNGGGNWTDLRVYNLNRSDSGQVPQSFDITPYAAANSQIRFLGGGGLINSFFFADNVQIQYSQGFTTSSGGSPPTLASGVTLMPGDIMTVTFQVMVDDSLPPTTSTLSNTATVTSDLQITPLSDSVTNPVQQADLTLTKLDGPDPVVAGQPLTYTLAITNNGPFTAQSVVVTDTLPSNLTITGVSPATTTQSGQDLGWNLGMVASGASQTIVISTQVDINFSGVLTNTAIVTSPTIDPAPGNNSGLVTTTVQAPAALQISKDDLVDPALVGQPVTYTLLITNAGPATATNVVVTDVLPAGLILGSATASQGPGCNQAGGVITCTLGALPSTDLSKVQSAFESGSEGWTVSGNGASTTPDYNVTGGDPGGYISDIDENGGDFYFVAPAKFLGNQAAVYLGALEFDLQRSAGSTYLVSADVILSGGGITVTTQIATPNTTWTHYILPLNEANWINTATDIPPTQQEMLTLLSNLNALQIRGDFVTGTGDSSGLDNVILRYGPGRVTIVATPTSEGTRTNNVIVNGNEPDPNLIDNTAMENTQALPGLSISNSSRVEGNSGTVGAVFTITLSASSAQVVTVNYATADGTAGASNFDYNPTSGSVTFPVGTTVQTRTILINGDTLEEADESFFVTLSAPTNAILINGQGTGTILNDDNDPNVTTVCFIPTQDAYYHEDAPDHNHDTDKELKISPDGGKRNHFVIEFDISPIPAGSTVLTSTFFLYEENAKNNQIIHLHRITSSWLEAEVTWDQRSATLPWSSPGGDYVASPEVASFNPDIDNQYRQIDVTGVTQDWVSGTFANYGLLLRSTGDNGEVKFRAREETNPEKQPKLCITYAEPQADLAVTKTVNNPTPLEGSSVIFTITATNNSPANATGIVISNILPAGLTHVANNSSQGLYSSTTGIWNVGNVATSTQATLRITATVNSGTAGTTITNTAIISRSDQIDPVPANNSASIAISPTLPTLSINDVIVSEGNSGTITTTFTVSLSVTSSQTVTVNYATANNTATASGDYTATSGTLTFTPGTLTQTLAVLVNGDITDEPDESYFVNLSGAVNATIADSQGLGTIADQDNPTLSISDVAVTEGNSGATSAVFTVTLSAAGVQTATINYATTNGTATTGSDYAARSGTLTFPPGTTQLTITVIVTGDMTAETDETSLVNLSNPTNTTISDGQGTGTIIDDDSAALCSNPLTTLTATQDTELNESLGDTNYGQKTSVELNDSPVRLRGLIQFDLASIPANSVVSCANLILYRLSGGDHPIAVHRILTPWVEGDGTNTNGATWNQPDKSQAATWTTAGGDFASPAVATYTSGGGDNVANITSLAQFWLDNPGNNHGVLIEKTAGGAFVEYASREDGTVSQRPRLVVQYIPGLVIDDVNMAEGGSGTTNAVFAVTLSSAATQTVTVDYATANGTAATTDNDYVAASGTITFTPGITQQTITVPVNGDTKHEADEIFFVNLSDPVNAGIRDGQATGTIINDEIGGMWLEPGGSLYLPIIIKSVPASSPERTPVAPPASPPATPEGAAVPAPIYLPVIYRSIP